MGHQAIVFTRRGVDPIGKKAGSVEVIEAGFFLQWLKIFSLQTFTIHTFLHIFLGNVMNMALSKMVPIVPRDA